MYIYYARIITHCTCTVHVCVANLNPWKSSFLHTSQKVRVIKVLRTYMYIHMYMKVCMYMYSLKRWSKNYVVMYMYVHVYK